jgi:hypothetical protein
MNFFCENIILNIIFSNFIFYFIIKIVNLFIIQIDEKNLLNYQLISKFIRN